MQTKILIPKEIRTENQIIILPLEDSETGELVGELQLNENNMKILNDSIKESEE